MKGLYNKKEIPGPGSYVPYSDFGQTNKKLSFGSRTQSLQGKFHKINSILDLSGENPGPGSYNYNKGIGNS